MSLIDRGPISDLCDEYQLQPKVFYDWQKQFFEPRAAAFNRGIAELKLLKRAKCSNQKRNCSGVKISCNSSTSCFRS
jgi:hypothetical protein